MPSSPVTKVVEHLRKTMLRREEDRLSDGQLLDRYLENRDEVAFAALVRRHGPMVWGVCRRIVGHAHDAEDAFQAAFLILVRKAAAVKPREAVGNWLYGVACHAALKARTASARVRAKEKQVTSMPEPANVLRHDREELQMLLDRELSALPEKYRLPVVLCDLEGRTRKEVAAQLKIPVGTLSSRLATAHQMLAKRLARHGLAVSGGSLAALFAQHAASASVPAAVVCSTIKTATLVAASQGAVAGVVSAKVAALTEGMMRTMLLTKLKIMTVIVLALTALGVGAGFVTYQALVPAVAGADQPGQASKPDKDKQPNKPAKTDKDKLQGTWIVVSAQFGGKPAPDEFVKSFKLVFVGDKVTVHPSDDGTEGGKGGSFTLDTKKKPKEIDFGGDDKTTKGIYTFEKEQLKLAMAEIGQDRPTEFKSPDGTRLILIVLKRVDKPEKNKQDEKAPDAPAAKPKEDKELSSNGAGGDPKTDPGKPADAKSPPEASKEQWGLTTQGLQMSISATGKDKVGNPEFQVAFRNVGEQDVTLNLGMMLANGKPLNGGKSLFPTNIRLNLTDDEEKTRELHFFDTRVAGRVDDYFVPLRVGSVYTLKLPLSQFWSPSTKEFTLELRPGKYQVSAQFEGGGAKHDSGRFLMNFWEGKLKSNTLKLEQ